MPQSYNRIPGARETAPDAHLQHEEGDTSSYSTQPNLQDDDYPHPETNATPVRRRLPKGWKSMVIMAVLFIVATGLAIGHHFYYDRLDGTEVIVVSSKWSLDAVRHAQEWQIRFGTAFAYLVKTMFAAAVGVAFQQQVWLTARRKAITMAGLDAMFMASNKFLSFLTMDFLKKAKVGAALAGLVWLIPISAILTPATLTVVPSTSSITKTQPVPTVNFSNSNPLFDYTASVIGNDGTSSDNGITPYMARLVSSSASSLQILPMNMAIPNSTYNMTFHGPSFRCHEPTALVHEAILMMLNATWFISAGAKMNNNFNSSSMAWLAFPPTSIIMADVAKAESGSTPLADKWMDFLSFAAACIAQPAMDSSNLPTFSSIPLCEGITRSLTNLPLANVSNIFPEYNMGRFWIWAQNTTYDCVLTDTEYHVRFFYSASENVQRVDPSYTFSWTENDLYGSYFAVANSLANILGGAIRGFATGIMSYKTRVPDTAIFGAFKANPYSDQSDSTGLAPVLLPPDIKALAQNKSVGELVEELSRNVTLSLFSADKVLAQSDATVNIVSNVNVYSYNKWTLIITYSVTFVLSFIALVFGTLAFLRNGVYHEVNFSTFMSTTRNPDLDDIIKNNRMGALHLSKETLKKTELKFGLLLDENEDPKDGAPTSIGFGIVDNGHHVTELKKGQTYYDHRDT